MEVLSPNGVKIYNMTVTRSAVEPDFIKEKKKRKKEVVKRNKTEKTSLELIQEFYFPTAASKIKTTEDGLNIMATGIYPPMIKCYQTDDLSLKFKRHLEADIVQFEILSDDFSKIAFLRSDRTIELHAKFGAYYNTRIPVFGRDIAYHQATCDLFAVGASPYVFRLNLEQGRFLKPYTSNSNNINVSRINNTFGILGVGGDEGLVECWDPRDRSHLAALTIHHPDIIIPDDQVLSITALNFSQDGLTMGVGTSTGHVLLYDLRSNKPYQIKDHQFDVPIVDIKFHEPSKHVISSCKKIIRAWDKDTGNSIFHIEPPYDINDTCVINNSGMILVGGEDPRMSIYYIPELGRAPSWCSFLDNITEELEVDESQTSVYQDYKFITQDELENLGISHLIGTPYLKAYMHGYFIDFRLYRKVNAIANPNQYREYLKDKIKEKIDEKRKSRISLSSRKAKVNLEYIEDLAKKRGDDKANNLLSDERFSRLWSDPAMKIDKSNR